MASALSPEAPEPIQILYDDDGDNTRKAEVVKVEENGIGRGPKTTKSPVSPELSQHGQGEPSVSSSPRARLPTNVNLSDPEQIIHLLETVDLSEEDTEVLLQEAYTMNRKLKEMLRRQEGGGSDKSKKHQKKSSSSSSSGSRSGSAAFASRTPLPPIRDPESMYGMRLKRSVTHIPARVHRPADAGLRSKSTKDLPMRSAEERGSPTRKSKAKPSTSNAEERPQWNNRFNYT